MRRNRVVRLPCLLVCSKIQTVSYDVTESYRKIRMLIVNMAEHLCDCKIYFLRLKKVCLMVDNKRENGYSPEDKNDTGWYLRLVFSGVLQVVRNYPSCTMVMEPKQQMTCCRRRSTNDACDATEPIRY